MLTTSNNQPLRIAQVAPLAESVPPKRYGGTERVVSYLVEELVQRGHEVTLFASGDSVTAARLVPGCPRSLRRDPRCRDPLAHHLVMLEQVSRMADRFDVIHFHIDYLHFPCSARQGYRHLTTLHGRLDLPDLQPLYRDFAGMPVVSISDAQREPLPWANWQGTVYHGLPKDLYELKDGSGSYLAFLGRISPEKRVDRAIEISLRAGKKLKIAAKLDSADEAYHRKTIAPLLRRNRADIEFVGEVGGHAKQAFLANAAALLFPIDWPEPFGLVMIEALACGTPVIAYRHGSVPEVLEDGVTGFMVDNQDAAVEAVKRLPELSRAECRRVFEQRFLVDRMADDYLALYHRCLNGEAEQAETQAGSGVSSAVE